MTLDSLVDQIYDQAIADGASQTIFIFGCPDLSREEIDEYRTGSGDLYDMEAAIRDNTYRIENPQIHAALVLGTVGSSVSASGLVSTALLASDGKYSLTGHPLPGFPETELRLDDEIVLQDHGILFVTQRRGSAIIGHDFLLHKEAGVTAVPIDRAQVIRSGQVIIRELETVLAPYVGRTDIDMKDVGTRVNNTLRSISSIEEADYQLRLNLREHTLNVFVKATLYGEMTFYVTVKV